MKLFFKKVLGHRNIVWLNKTKANIRLFVLSLTIRSNFLIFISLLFDVKYFLEHKSFLKGSYHYQKTSQKRKNIYSLRRNIHRIEKGLLMKNRRVIFALDFIEKTVDIYLFFLKNKNDDSVMEWAKDVLDDYFNKTKSEDINYSNARNKFYNYFVAVNKGGLKKTPFELQKQNANFSYEDYLSFNRGRKSVRWYKQTPVKKQVFEKALDIASLSPSSCNRQPFYFYISNNDKSLTQKIAELSQGTAGWSDNIPSIVVLVGSHRAFMNSNNRHSIYVDASLSVLPFINALELLGLSTCIINWADIPNRERKMKAILGLEQDEKIILSIAVGYNKENEKVAFSMRKNNKEISKFI